MTRTDTYIGTFTNDLKDSARIKELRKFLTGMNKMLKNDGKPAGYYIKLQGRLGKDNPNAWKYRIGCPREYQTMWGQPQSSCIRLDDAAYADAYIYRRR